MKLDKEFLLKESKYFCMAPWIHMHMWPNGETFPCCIAPADENNRGMGNFNNMTVKELWNCDTMNKLRLNMLNERPSKECNKCYELEETGDVWTLRKNLSREFKEKFYRVEQTHTDGSHDDPQFYYWDIRFNNLCNMKCRTCGPEFSTSWWQDYEHLKNKKSLIALTNKSTFWEEIRPLVDNIESVYFAGGEPLITDEHYTMLDIWLEQNRQDKIKISYTTNFSRLKHKGKNVLDYWKHFKNNVDVVASLDGSHKRGEWIRKGTRWSKIVSNRKEMKKALPNTMFGITPTVSAYNVWHLPDFFKEWIELDLIKPWDIRINLLTTPECMRTQVLPYNFKKEVEEKWIKFCDWLEHTGYSKEKHNEMFTYFEGVIKFMWENDRSNEIPELLKHVNQWDRVRSENMFKVFPELEILKEYV
tara:strand:+ start:4710 stop:5960 length:1251 start_codon:yes stop_codon:yes gene_type:complete